MPEDPIDRYARGELSHGESRDLAQEALDDPELFEDLTAIAVAKAAVSAPHRPARARWPIWMAVAAGVAVVAGGLLKMGRSPTSPATRPPLASILLASG